MHSVRGGAPVLLILSDPRSEVQTITDWGHLRGIFSAGNKSKTNADDK